MYKLRVKYQKTGDLKFLSHLDLIRAFERGLRRAGLPFSLSKGFSPHPKISFGPPLPVGVSSESEYVDVVLNKHLPLKEVASSLHSAFPGDLSCQEVRYIPPDSPSLMSVITLASYRIVVSVQPILTLNEIKSYIDLLLAQNEITLNVREKQKIFQVKRIVRNLDLERLNEDIITFKFFGLVGSAGGVRPDILIRTLFTLADRSLSIEFREIHRTGLYWEKEGKLKMP